MQQVHLRINDAATGKPTPARLRITDPDGVYYAPHGRLTEFATHPNQDVGGNVLIGARPWAYIDGACEILLPPGLLRVEISKGPEYRPIDETMTLLAGKMAMRFTLERWSDIRQQGWYPGDTRVHFLTPDAALLEGQAEDVAVVNLLAKETMVKDAFGKPLTAIPNILAFSGQAFARQVPGFGVAVGTQNTHPDLGSLGLLHCHRVVYPLSFGGPQGREDWTLDDWCDQCHRKNGLVIWTNPQNQSADFLYGEPLADLIRGKIDAFELSFWEDSPFDTLADYYRLLDAGLIVPLVGASGKDSNGVVLGGMRTYAQLAAEFSYPDWIEAVRAGRTFVSNAPLLHFTVDGQVPGQLVPIERARTPVRVRAEAKSLLAFEHLELLWNGHVIASASPTSSEPWRAQLELELPIEQSGWLAARCRGEALLPSRPGPQRVFAHTSPVAVRLANADRWATPTALQSLLDELDAMLRWAREKARCPTPHDRERLVHVFEEALAVLAKKRSG